MKKVENTPSVVKWFPLLTWMIALLPVLMICLLLLMAGLGAFGELPSFEELENPNSNLATVVYTADGEILGKYFLQNRTSVNFEDLSPDMVKALVATEDERYYEHSGIDMRGLGRAIINLGRSGGASTITQQLSKMLFSDLPKSKLERVLQKFKEWIIAVRLERHYTKSEIIAMYLNRFDFLNNAVGIESAAWVYFNKKPSELDLVESATLVGMAKNPSLFNPLRNMDTTVHRRNVVFFQMKRNGLIDQEAFDTLREKPIVLNYQKVDHKEGLAPYFREVMRLELREMFAAKDASGQYIYHKPNGQPYNMYKDGLVVYTTIDSRLQKYAEWAVAQHLKVELQDDFFRDLKKKKNAPFDWKTSEEQREAILNHAKRKSHRYQVLSGQECENCGRRGSYLTEKNIDGVEMIICKAEDCEHTKVKISEDSIDAVFNSPDSMQVFTWRGDVDTLMSPMDSIKYYKSFLQAGMMSMDPHTGNIKAWVGGIDYQHFRYDHVKLAKRQVGSTIKPFLYATAIQKGYSPCYEIPNTPVTIHKGNWGLLRDWTPKTDGNNFHGMVSIKYGLANSMNNVTAWIMKQFGPYVMVDFVKEVGIKSPMKPVPSLCLGVEDVSLYEMVGAISTFANKGVWIEPTFIAKIEDKNGNVIVDVNPKTNEAMTEEAAYVMLDLMKGVVAGVYNKYKPKNKTTGTAMRLRLPTEVRPYGGFRNPIAAKTGTTQNHSDGWFLGLTPDLVTGVWVGAEDPGVRFSTLSKGMGTNMALPMWGYFMQKVYADSTIKVSKGDFEKPEKKISIELDCNAYGTGQDAAWEMPENEFEDN
ncbi:MAG: transglycosylase domain-containing protein [Vicingaceae bacterium]